MPLPTSPQPRHLASWEQEGLGQSYPEPLLGVLVGVVTERDEFQDARKLFRHGLALHRNKTLHTSP